MVLYAAETAQVSTTDGTLTSATAGDLTVTEPGMMNLGYAIARRHWGQGYAAELAQALARIAFVDLAVPRDIMHDLTATGGMAHVNGVLQVEMRGERREIVGVALEINAEFQSQSTRNRLFVERAQAIRKNGEIHVDGADRNCSRQHKLIFIISQVSEKRDDSTTYELI